MAYEGGYPGARRLLCGHVQSSEQPVPGQIARGLRAPSAQVRCRAERAALPWGPKIHGKNTPGFPIPLLKVGVGTAETSAETGVPASTQGDHGADEGGVHLEPMHRAERAPAARHRGERAPAARWDPQPLPTAAHPGGHVGPMGPHQAALRAEHGLRAEAGI